MSLNDAFNFVGWITGGIGIGWVALAIFAPSVLSVVAEYLKALSPLLKGASEGVVALAKLLWEGVKDMGDNLGSILLVATVALMAFFYGSYGTTKCDCKKCIDNLRADYRFVPRTKSEKLEYKKQKGIYTWPWEGWF